MTRPHTHGGTDAPECRTCQDTMPAPRDGLAGSDEAVEAAAKAGYEHCRDVEETEWERGRWERLEPAHRERYLRAAHRAVTAAEPFIAARVRAEAVAERDAHWRQRLADLQAEYARIEDARERRLAEAVAEERQRIRDALNAEILAVTTRYIGTTEAALGYMDGLSKGLVLAAGSVPVATPSAPECEHGMRWPHRYLPVPSSSPCPGPVATPAETRDPTHGRIDADIQRAVDAMEPPDVGSRVAMENTLQARRDAAEPSVGTGTPAEEGDQAEHRREVIELLTGRYPYPAETVSGGSGHAEPPDGGTLRALLQRYVSNPAIRQTMLGEVDRLTAEVPPCRAAIGELHAIMDAAIVRGGYRLGESERVEALLAAALGDGE